MDSGNQLIFDNPLRKYLFVLIAILIGSAIQAFIFKVCCRPFIQGSRCPGKRVLTKNAFVKLLLDPLEIFLISFITIAGIDKLSFPKALEFEFFEVPFKSIVHGLAKTILIVVFIWLLLRVIDFISLVVKEKARLAGGVKDHQLVFFSEIF